MLEKQVHAAVVLSLLATALGCASGDAPERDTSPDGFAESEEVSDETSLESSAPDAEVLGVLQSAQVADDECPGPRPPNRGCRITCKPCQFAVCEGGEWVYESVDWGDMCRPIGGGGGQCCQRGAFGFCPAECQCCSG